VPKTYLVTVTGRPSAETLARWRHGIELEDGVTRPAQVKIVEHAGTSTKLEFVLREGRKRQIRRMCAAGGHQVERLCRIKIGNLSLGDLAPGAYRHLQLAEVTALKELAAGHSAG